MRIVTAVPPNFKAINDRFNVRGKPVIFCYGDAIFNPMRVAVGPDLVAHERVHSMRQLAHPGGVSYWWDRYIADNRFRLEEEIPAHRAEYQYWAQRADADRPVKGFRSAREFHELQIAQRLSGPLYGGLISLSQAKALIS